MGDLNIGDVKVAVSHFLEVVVNARGDETERIATLERALDLLAWIQQVAATDVSTSAKDWGAGNPEDGSLQSPQDYEKMRQIVAQKFPSFDEAGTSSIQVRQNGTSSAERRNAGDDLAGIACELYQVAQQFQNGSDAEALADFVDGYRQRWRTKLRSLQWYVESRR